jgi:hypothetical protein
MKSLYINLLYSIAPLALFDCLESIKFEGEYLLETLVGVFTSGFRYKTDRNKNDIIERDRNTFFMFLF